MKTFNPQEFIKKNLTKNEIIVAKHNNIKLDLVRWYGYYNLHELHKKAEERISSIRKSLSKITSGDVNSAAARIIAERNAKEKAIRDHNNELKKISSLIDDYKYSITSFLYDYVRLGVNRIDTPEDAKYGNANRVWVISETERNGYSRRCHYSMTRYGARLTIKKGYRIRLVGGIITFYRGKWKNDGMKCEWMEQGRAYEDCVMRSGYVVRGEHIEGAKSIKDAQRINKEKRDAAALALKLSRIKSANNKNVMVHFSDSLGSGNCQAGTNNFKHKVEEYLGHEIETLTVAEVRKYGKMFNVQSYAERACRYAIAKANKTNTNS